MVFLAISGEVCFSLLDSCRKTYYSRYVFGAATQTTFLTTANCERMERNTVGKIERADTFRTTTLRGVQRQKVDTKTSDVDIEEVESLGGVGVEVERGRDSLPQTFLAHSAKKLRDFGEWLDGAELIIGQGDRY